VTVTSTAIYANTGQLVANSATGVVQIGLATSGANPGNYGSGTTTPVITVDSLGRITSVSSVLITGGSAGTGSTTFNRTTVTATAGQTLFSSIPHTVGYLQVHVNGVLMTPNDYTANASNSSVVLTQACSVGDQVDVFAYTTTLANNLSPGTTGGSAGVILYQSAANTTGNTIVGTSGQVLTSAGTGQPTWTTLSTVATSGSASDLGSGTLPTARISGSYTGITGVGTLAAGSIPSSLVTGLTVGSTANTQTFTTTGTWYKPAGVSMARIQVWAGGGGSGRNGAAGGGGGGGAYTELIIPVSYLASSVTATVGTGGTASNSQNVAGGVGGNSTFPLATAYNSISTLSAYGGGGAMATPGGGGGGGGGGSLGAGGNAYNVGNSPMSGAAGNGAVKGQGGLSGGYDGGGLGGDGSTMDYSGKTSVYGGGGGVGEGGPQGGGSVYGGGGGGGTGGGAGSSVYGGSGGAAGSAGTAPGGGGGASGGAAGAGAAGRIIVFCW
jgi:hypothetical protein